MLGRASSRSLALNVQVMLGILAGRPLGAETGIDRTRVVCHLVRSNEALRASLQRLAFPQAALLPLPALVVTPPQSVLPPPPPLHS